VAQRLVPPYHEIEQSLRLRVQRLAPGDALPSDAMLCHEFRVSRMTARGAMQALVRDGLAVREPGRGTFVAAPRAHRHAAVLPSFTLEMRRRGRTPASRVLRCEVREPTVEQRADLALLPAARVVEVRRLRLADGEPVAVETAVLPASLARDVLTADLEAGSLHALLVAIGRTPTSGRATITAAAATVEEAALLGVPAGAPLLVERRLVLDGRGRPLERTESRYVPGRYALGIDFDVVTATVDEQERTDDPASEVRTP
jgi:GntR family transcriptional regulator